MKKIIIILTVLIISCSCDSNGNARQLRSESKNEDGILSYGFLKGIYVLSGRKYYLIDFSIINNTNDSIRFLTYYCSTGSNVVTDLKNYIVNPNFCTRNGPATIILDPSQKFTVTLVLSKSLESKDNDEIKLGWIFIPETAYNIEHLEEFIFASKGKLKNIIWSKPIELKQAISQPYEIH